MKSTTTQQAIRWAVFCVLVTWGILSFLVLCGEENPEEPMSFVSFLVWKIAALVNLIVCYQIGKRLNKRGWLPNLNKHFGSKNYEH